MRHGKSRKPVVTFRYQHRQSPEYFFHGYADNRKLTQDSLILKRGELLLKYARNNEALNQETIPAAVLTPAKKLLSVKGELVVGHEVRSFKAEGDSADYWIVDETGELMQKYDDMTKGIKNGKPVYVELEVVDMGKADDGFAADYEGVYQIMKINKMALK